MAVNQLAAEYADQPVLLLEHDVDNSTGNRSSRWWSAFDGNYVILPMIMVGSGHQITNGSLDFYTTYKGMIESELARPPGAELQAIYRRDGDRLVFDLTVTNQSGVPLGYNNSATVGAIIYEEKQIQLTGRFVRDNVVEYIAGPLENGDQASFTLTSNALTGVDWSRIRVVVYVEYRPGSGSAYDMLQAAVPQQAALTVTPTAVAHMLPAARTTPLTQTLTLAGAGWENWSIDTTGLPTWLAVDPADGSIGTHPQLTIDPDQLADGWQETDLTITATRPGANLQKIVPVTLYRGVVYPDYLPFVRR